MPTLRLLLILTTAFSLGTLPSVLSSNLHLPSIPVVRAQQETTTGSWYPAGAQEQTLSISEGNGASGTQVGWLINNQVDAEDSPLTANQQQLGSASGGVNCPSNTAILCSLPVPDHGYFEIEFNLAGIMWGIPMNYGNSIAGVELRQGIAHLLNKQSFTANNPACLGVACVPDDQAIPVCTISVGCTNGGLYAANPCGWDTLFPETSSPNCVVGAPGGTAYNCSYSTACPSGTVTGTTQYSGQVTIGSSDFCAAAQHFVRAFKIQLGINVTENSHCELLSPTGGWPAAVYAVNPIGGCDLSAVANVCIHIRQTEPRKSLGVGLAQEICALFSPAWTGGAGWTTLAGTQVDCTNSNTGTGNAACGGGSCPFMEAEEDTGAQFCAYVTSVTGTPYNCWGMYTAGFGEVFPFDSTTYFEYNSLFSTKTTVTCTSADCSSNVPGSPCASTTFSNAASNYMYICSPTYDSLSSAMEFSPCLSAIGDPTPNVATPTFVNCSSGVVGSGAGSTSCIGASCTAISAGYQAEDYFGSHVLTLPIWSGLDTQGRLSNWALGGSSPGMITAFGGGSSASANYFNWLNVYSATAVAGTFRQSFLTTVSNLNPFDFTVLWEGYLLGNIYDSLFVQNPLCNQTPPTTSGVNQCSSILQNIDWMTTSHSFLCYAGGPACTSTTLGYGNATYFAGTTADLRLTLNRSNHWQDSGPVTAWDLKYSFMNLNATGAFQATALASVTHLNVLDEFTLDLNLRAKGPFTELFIGGITIIPGHVWSACGASTWNSGVTGENIAGTNIVNAA
jgi:hypothetical protein